MSTSTRTLVAFAAASVLFGGNFVAAKEGLSFVPPLLFVSLRFDLAAVALAAYVVYAHSRGALLPRTRGDVVGILATGVLSVGLANALIYFGEQYASSGVAAIVFSLNPILTPVFAGLLLSDERLGKRGAVGLVVGLLGVVLVIHPTPANVLAGGAAKALLFGGAVAGALGAVLIRWSDGGLDSDVRTAWALPVAAVLTHAMAFADGETFAAARWTPTAVESLLYVGVLAGAVAYVAYFGLLDETGPIRANLVFYLVPVVATLGGWALLGEAVTPLTVAGFLVVFAGFAVLGSADVDTDGARAALADRVPGFVRDAVGGTESVGATLDESSGFESD